jgi:anti-sigma B factor antagonist
MEIDVSQKGDRTKVTLIGDIYVEQGDELSKVFNTIAEKNPKEVVIDLTGLNSITSSGIGKIVLLYKELNKKSGTVRITGVNKTIMEIFKVVKLDKLVEIETL